MLSCLSGVNRAEGEEVLRFLKKYGCVGIASDKVNDFMIGPWLFREGMPTGQKDCIAIIFFFSDDASPIPQPKPGGVFVGNCLYTDQVIQLYDVERYSIAELAVTLLHEGRHARHRMGGTLEDLTPLDADDRFHEGNTWIQGLILLNAWGKERWGVAVRNEINWIKTQSLIPRDSNQILYVESPEYWKELDLLFGATQFEEVRLMRKKLVSLQANMVYWAERNTTLHPEQVCHSIVAHNYM